MQQILRYLETIIPATSLLHAKDPVIPMLLTVLLSVPSAIVLLQLAWYSAGVKIALNKSVWPGTILGVSISVARQLIAVPFHVLVSIVLIILFVRKTGKVSLAKAVIASLFTESVVFIGSIIFLEPLFLITTRVEGLTGFFANNALGVFLGIVLETLGPAITLLVFMKRGLTLTGYQEKHPPVS